MILILIINWGGIFLLNKKWISAVCASALLLTAGAGITGTPQAQAAKADIKVALDGKILDLDTNPIIVNGTTLVPYRSLVKSLGASANWDSASKSVTVNQGEVNVKLSAGSSTAYINNSAVSLDAAPVVRNGSTFVPLRLLAEAFGKWTSWDAASQSVSINSSLTLDTSTGSFTLKKKPKRIVTLSSADTEIIYALGGSVVGRPTSLGSVNTPEAASAVEVGSTHGILYEKLASVKPDLVIASPSLKSEEATITKLGAQVLFHSHNTYEDIKGTVRLYGKLLGNESKAQQLIADMDKTVSGIKKPAPKPKALIVYGAPGSFVIALPTSYSEASLNSQAVKT